MRNIIFFYIIFLTIVSISCSRRSNQNSNDQDTIAANVSIANAEVIVKKYQIKSGIITFDNDLMGIKQKSVLYFDDYGMKEVEEKYDGGTIKETNLCDGKNRYLLMHSQKIAYTSGTCFRGVAYKFDWEEISKADKEYKVNKLPNITIAGKNCESYSMGSGDYPTVFAGWSNVCLFMNTESKFGKVIMKAVKIEENVSIPAEKFQIPEGYEIKKGL